jgi:pSer/pThr/pTyr-binding forkhead associated (FHA) protein
MPTLLALSVGPDISLDRDVLTVGRHPECDIRLGSLRVSRRHCIITTDRGDVVVRDLGSTNGTWINGRRVAAAQIRPGDEVLIADVRYLMEKAPPLRAVVADPPSRLDDE